MPRKRNQDNTASITFVRIEPVGFVSVGFEYQIDGTVSPYIPATFYDPPDGGEVEVTRVTCTHPVTGKVKELPFADWPFSSVEMSEIEEKLARAPQQDLYDESYDPDD